MRIVTVAKVGLDSNHVGGGSTKGHLGKPARPLSAGLSFTLQGFSPRSMMMFETLAGLCLVRHEPSLFPVKVDLGLGRQAPPMWEWLHSGRSLIALMNCGLKFSR